MEWLDYVTLVMSTSLVGILTYHLIQWIQFVRKVDRIPGLQKASVIFGDLQYIQPGIDNGQSPGESFLRVLEGFLKSDEFKNYNGYFKFWLGPYPILVPTCPEACEAVLGSNKLIEKATFYDSMHPWLGLGLITR